MDKPNMPQERYQRLCAELEILQKPVWTWKDIADFRHCASAKANEIRKMALNAGGKIDFNKHAVQSRTVLFLMGTTPEAEIQKRMIELKGWADQKQEKESNHDN